MWYAIKNVFPQDPIILWQYSGESEGKDYRVFGVQRHIVRCAEVKPLQATREVHSIALAYGSKWLVLAKQIDWVWVSGRFQRNSNFQVLRIQPLVICSKTRQFMVGGGLRYHGSFADQPAVKSPLWRWTDVFLHSTCDMRMRWNGFKSSVAQMWLLGSLGDAIVKVLMSQDLVFWRCKKQWQNMALGWGGRESGWGGSVDSENNHKNPEVNGLF